MGGDGIDGIISAVENGRDVQRSSNIKLLRIPCKNHTNIIMSSEEANVKKVLGALERLKKEHMGQYLDNICDDALLSTAGIEKSPSLPLK